MFRFTGLVAGVLVFAATGSAFAQDGKFKLGLRLGYAVPSGKVTGDTTVGGVTVSGEKLSDSISGQVPIWLDAGYMVTPNILVGLYGQYGFASVKNCDAGASCSAHDIRFGVQGQYHIMPDESVDPWLGVGFGYESLGVSESEGALSIDGSITGWEFLNLQGGVDFQVANAFTVGPFLSFSLDQFSSVKSGGNSADINNTALHEWITFGAKGTFGI
ncbi:MAG TPA: outer membrane beta-barrel protein [Polyangiaceae bacterium]|jgi:outer membrane protein W|nr:outer membrane beta-barrel protein [Polyangiaceae bacterium]